ncbi:MAG: hypothetical protein SGPRY_011383, partial [Prymnesium sp.]
VGEAEGWEAVDEAILMRELKAEAVERAEIEQTIALSERLSPQGSLPLSHKLSTEGAQMNEAVQAIAKSVHDMERARDRFEAHGNLRRDVFISEMGRLLKLAIDGLAGCLHSVQSLRNQELSRSSGDVHAAGQRIIQVVSALSNLIVTQMDASVNFDDDDVTAACIGGIGLPLALSLPLWQRLRRLGLLCELLGHDMQR